MRDAVIVSAVRTPVGRAPRGAFHATRPDDLAAVVLRAALDRAPAVDPASVDDVMLGCAMPEAEQGLNVARISSLRAGLPIEIAGTTINRLCASGLQAIAFACERVRSGSADVVLAGGTESMSLVPMGGHVFRPNPSLMTTAPDVYLTTGLVAEAHARDAGITRDAQDAFALRSHHRAIAALDAGRFRDELVPITIARVDSEQGRPVSRDVIVEIDEGPRRETSAAALAQLKPAFHAAGTVTAGNSSQMSDGAAAALVMDASRAARLGLAPLARFVGYAVVGVDPGRFTIGPVPAVKKVLAATGLSLEDIDLIEMNEAFAAQVLACLQALPMDEDRLNVNGGAIALGHPLGCTGARLTASLLHEMRRRRARYGLVTMCVGGGMGAAAVFEAC